MLSSVLLSIGIERNIISLRGGDARNARDPKPKPKVVKEGGGWSRGRGRVAITVEGRVRVESRRRGDRAEMAGNMGSAEGCEGRSERCNSGEGEGSARRCRPHRSGRGGRIFDGMGGVEMGCVVTSHDLGYHLTHNTLCYGASDLCGA